MRKSSKFATAGKPIRTISTLLHIVFKKKSSAQKACVLLYTHICVFCTTQSLFFSFFLVTNSKTLMVIIKQGFLELRFIYFQGFSHYTSLF